MAEWERLLYAGGWLLECVSATFSFLLSFHPPSSPCYFFVRISLVPASHSVLSPSCHASLSLSLSLSPGVCCIVIRSPLFFLFTSCSCFLSHVLSALFTKRHLEFNFNMISLHFTSATPGTKHTGTFWQTQNTVTTGYFLHTVGSFRPSKQHPNWSHRLITLYICIIQTACEVPRKLSMQLISNI